MGSGKTTVGTHLAEFLDLPFYDLDREVEGRTGRQIAEIFAMDGENTFRDLEHESLREILTPRPLVLALGGGAWLEERNRQLLRGQGTSVWLAPELPTILERLGPEERYRRPLLADQNKVEALFGQRRESYALADLHIDIDRAETAEQVAARIARLIRGKSCAI